MRDARALQLQPERVAINHEPPQNRCVPKRMGRAHPADVIAACRDEAYWLWKQVKDAFPDGSSLAATRAYIHRASQARPC